MSFNFPSLERWLLKELFRSSSLVHELDGNGRGLGPGTVKLERETHDMGET